MRSAEASLQGLRRAADAGSLPGQRSSRLARPIRDFSEYLAFLDEVEEIFGPSRKLQRPARGGRFLL